MMDLQKKILEEIDGKTLNYCFSCGICTAGCPSAKVTDSKYNPRRILHQAVLEGSMGAEVWLCTNCYTCQERCPTKTRVGDIISLMRRIYVSEKGIPSFIKPLVENLGSCGFTANIGELENKRRERMSLPPVKSNLEVRKIIELTGGGL
jgi:heterodisulfide reductase subunit C